MVKIMAAKSKTKKKRPDTARKILDAAIHSFSQVGFDGARVDEIARLAGVNKAAIYYHLGDKQALYEKVLHEVFSNIAALVVEKVDDATDPTDKLAAYIKAISQLPVRHPHMPAIMMREIAAGGKNLPPVVIGEMVRIIETLAGIIDQGVREQFFKRIPAITVHFMVVGPMMFHNRLKPLIEENAEVFQGIDPDADIPTDIIKDVQQVLLTALTSAHP